MSITRAAAILIGLCLLPLLARADDVLTDSDLRYLVKFGVKPENLGIKYIDLWQKAHLHFLINDPQIQDRDKEVDFYLDFVTRCAKTLDLAGVTPVSCDYAPPGHP